MRFKNQLFVMMAVFLGFLASGCGSKVQGTADAARVMKYLGTIGQSHSTMAPSLRVNDSARVLNAAKDHVEGHLWLNHLRSGSQSVATMTTCPEAFNQDGVSCTSNCPSAGVINMTCTIAENDSVTCGSTTYTMTSAGFNLSMDLSGLSFEGENVTGSMSMNLSVGANISGGELTGERLDCSYGMTLNFANLSNYEPSCSDFSCKLGNETISCEDFSAEQSSSTETCS